ncbi:MAG: AAA family ATPase [Candidatus Rokubacteria bacterium]|nr:AAA family ATPase [Candidatus Rokubacteria bacterium]
MKGIVFLLTVPVLIFFALCAAVLDITFERARASQSSVSASSAGLTFGGFWTELGVFVLVGAALIAGVIVYERRRARREQLPPPRRRRRRSTRTGSLPMQLPERLEMTPAVAQGLTPAPARAEAPAPARAALPIAPISYDPPAPVRETSLVVAPITAESIAAESIAAESSAVESPAPALEAAVTMEAAPSLLDELMAQAPLATLPPAPVTAPRPADPLRHWGLREPAFDNAPSTRFLYLSPEHAEALFRLRYAIHHRKGCAMLTGTYGCGKTTLTRALVRELDPARYDVALVANPLLTPLSLLQELLYQLGVPVKSDDKPTLVRALEARLSENLQRGRDTVVIVDEAQLIEDDAVFNELRLLLNFQTNDRFLVTLVLAGSDELLQTLKRQPHLAQRCVVRAGLEPLDREQTGHYVRHRLSTAGCETAALTDDAVDALFSATGGTPRVINAVCDLTLYVGAAAGVRRVDAELVRRVAGDIAAAA